MKVTENRKGNSGAFVAETRYITILTHDGTLIRLTCSQRHASQPWKVTYVSMDHGSNPEELERAYRLALMACVH